MKKVLILGLLFLGFIQIAKASNFERENVWRVSIATGTFYRAIVDTVPIHIERVVVSSGNPSGTMQMYNSSSTDTGVDISTSGVYSTSASNTFQVNRDYWKGLVYSSTGTSVFEIQWEYIYTVPAGHENRGR